MMQRILIFSVSLLLLVSGVHAEGNVAGLREAVARGGVVNVPSGRYVLTHPLVIDTRIRLTFAPGAVLVADWDGGHNPVVLVRPAAGGSILQGMTIDGQDNNLRGLVLTGDDIDNPLVDVTVLDFHARNLGRDGLRVQWHCHDIVIRNVQLDRTQLASDGAALTVRHTNKALVEDVIVRQSGGKGVGADTCRDVTIRNVTVYDTHWDAGDGIHTTNSRNVLIENAHVHDAQGNALKLSRNSVNVTVRNSVFNKHDRGEGSALHIQGGREHRLHDTMFIYNGSLRQAIRIADHPRPSLAEAADNVLHDNHVVHLRGTYLNDLARSTDYRDNVESRRPQISRMRQAGRVGLPVHNLTRGEVHFDGGGFERGRVGNPPDTYDTFYGTWGNVRNDVTIVDRDATGVEPFAGTRFVRLRDSRDGDRPQLTSGSDASGRAGERIRASFVFRVDEGVLRLRIRGEELFADLLFASDGAIQAYDQPGGSRMTLPVTHNARQWNTAVIEYVLGESQGQLMINDSQPQTFIPWQPSTNVTTINFRSEGDAALLAYIDAVIEPAQ